MASPSARHLVSYPRSDEAAADDSFTSAWSIAQLPRENRAFVERFTAEVGIPGYRFVSASTR